ncbi:Uncharacterised protein [Bordetella pertussis]|nr:Uncharacterised protein [Bordetella pertussis]CPN09109.1 Uncharacterised protein [Bordetella pertussis]CPO76404.1 Uncharacterised protein [Bordetella pertussis]
MQRIGHHPGGAIAVAYAPHGDRQVGGFAIGAGKRVRAPGGAAGHGHDDVLPRQEIGQRLRVAGKQAKLRHVVRDAALLRQHEFARAAPAAAVARVVAHDVAHRGAQGHRAADRIAVAIRHDGVDIAGRGPDDGAVDAPQSLAALPPAEFGDRHVLVQIGVDFRAQGDFAVGRAHAHPIPAGYAAGPRGLDAQVHLGLGRLAPQRSDVPVRRMHEPAALGRAHDQRVCAGVPRRRIGRLDMDGQRGLADVAQGRAVDLHPAVLRGKADGLPVAHGLVLLMDKRLRKADALGLPAQGLHIDTQRRQLVVPARIHVRAKERIAQPQAARQLQHDLVVRARLAGGLHHPGAQLHVLHGRLRDLETQLQRFALPGHVGRQDDVRVHGGRVHAHVDVHVEVQGLQRLQIAGGLGLRDQQVRPEADQRAHRIGVLLQDGPAEVARRDPSQAGRPEGQFVQPQRLGALHRRQQLPIPVDGAIRRRHGPQVAALSVACARQGV